MQNLANNSRNANRSQILVTLAMVAALIVGALLSATILADHFSSPQAYSHQIEKLDEKRDTVMGMSVAAATASSVISIIPDDVCTPVANELADVCTWLTFVLAAIFFEKYCLTTLGLALFRVVIPACCAILACTLVLRNNEKVATRMMKAAGSIFVFSLILWASVPVSIVLTDHIEETHQASIEAAISSTEEVSAEAAQLNSAEDEAEDKNLAERAHDFFFGAGSAVDNALSKANEMLEWGKTVLSTFTEGIAVMIVTTCIIPILVPVVLYKLACLIFRKAS